MEMNDTITDIHDYTVLLVDDDVDILDNNTEYLAGKGYRVLAAGSGNEALALVSQADIVVLDVGLPDIDGFALVPQMMRIKRLPILFLTARSDDWCIENGFALGADYMKKPYSIKELSLRIQSILTRSSSLLNGILTLAPLSVNTNTLSVSVHDIPILLTPREFTMLTTLIQARGTVLTYEAIYARIWGGQGFAISIVAQHMSSVRRKLELASRLNFIRTVRGVGYSFLYPPEPVICAQEEK